MTEMGETMGRKCISIIVPAKNEEENLPRAYDEITSVMSAIPYDYEVIVIDNFSIDKTGEIAEEICEKDKRWKYIQFSRDFSSEISIAAGLEHCIGDAAIVLFSDLQDPCDRIPDFIKKWEEGYDIVYGKLKKRSDNSWLRSLAVWAGYFLINKLSDVQIPPNATDFRLYSRDVINAIKRMHERNRYMRGFAHWVGFRTVPIEYDRNPRKAGKSKAPFYYLIAFTLNAIITFSIRPLRLFTYFGILIMIISMILGAVYIEKYIANKGKFPGFTTAYLLILINIGVTAMGFGILGEYIGNIYNETKRRPLWIIRKYRNIDVNSKVFPDE